MGQYQQWLYHREVDEQLGKRLDQLQTELALLQAQAHTLAETTSSTSENTIIQALLDMHAPQADQSHAHTSLPEPLFIDEPLDDMAIPHNIFQEEESETAPVSPALFAWSRLPNLDAQKMQLPASNTTHSGALPKPGEEGLLPQDMASFFHQHAQPVPQPALPAWLENVISAPTAQDQLPNNPVDQQTLRTNRLVERWLERWRKTPSGSQEQREDQKNESHRE